MTLIIQPLRPNLDDWFSRLKGWEKVIIYDEYVDKIGVGKVNNETKRII